MRAFQCWRLTRAHHPVDIDKRLFTAVIAVSGQRVAQMRTKIDIVHKQDTDRGLTGLDHAVQDIFADLVTGFGQHFTCLHIDKIISQKTANQIFISSKDTLDTRIGKLAQKTRCHFRAGSRNDLACLGIDQVTRQHVAFQRVSVEFVGPAVFRPLVGNGLVEFLQDFVARHADNPPRIDIFARLGTCRLIGKRICIRQRHQESGYRQLALAVDTNIQDILGVKLEIEP